MSEHPAADAVEGAITTYGKVGLLVDDAPDAGGRLAAEVYGTDTLPEWWVQVDTIADGLAGVTAIHAVLAKGTTFPHIVVVDRYLPIRARAERPVDWRRHGGSECHELDIALARLDRRAVVLVTSFPKEEAGPRGASGAAPGETAGALRAGTSTPFQPRTANPVHLAASSSPYKAFLAAYGPIPPREVKGFGSVTWTAPDPALGAREWWSAIDTVGRALSREEDQVLLVTGAGMSRWDRPGSAGVPGNDDLVTLSAWWALAHRLGPQTLPRPRLPPQRGDRPGGQPLYQAIRAPSVDERSEPLVGPLRTRADRLVPNELESLPDILALYWMQGWSPGPPEFNKLFLTPDGTPAPWEDVNDHTQTELSIAFEQGMRLAITLHDRGMTWQHRAAALLPFDAIITTNFDGLHERAALTAAAEAKSEKHAIEILARGIPMGGPHGGGSAVTGRLLRLYGSVWHGESLAFRKDEFDERCLRLSTGVTRREDQGRRTLVVVGHGLYEAPLPTALAEQVRSGDTIVLVNPNLSWARPFGASSPACGDTPAEIHAARKKLLKKEGITLHFAEGGALAFLYDLWTCWRGRNRAGAPWRW